MAESSSSEATSQAISKQLDCVATAMSALETKFNELNGQLESVLLQKVSDRKFCEIIESNEELAKLLQKIMDDEVQLRAEIHHAKLLYEDIRKLNVEIIPLASDENILQMKQKKQEELENCEKMLKSLQEISLAANRSQ